MKLTIHRGTHEIGGSCVEIENNDSRIVIDIGMPITKKDGQRFEYKNYRHLDGPTLVKEKILPDVNGIYEWDKENKAVDGLLISHAHIDHYGFSNYLRKDTHFYLGEGTKRLIELSSIFSDAKVNIKHYAPIKSERPFQVGSFTITPYLMDHSAFDAYAFLVESHGKRILYSGDFREHGRKPGALKKFLAAVPEGVDALLLEGTLLGRNGEKHLTEEDIESELVEIIKSSKSIVFVTLASQNIDRLVSFYKAALQADRLFVIDVYTAMILDALHDIRNIPSPKSHPSLRVFFPKNLCDSLKKAGKWDIARTNFGKYKASREWISQNLNKIVMIVRSSIVSSYLSKAVGIDQSATAVYSMWEGYLKDTSMKGLLNFFEQKGIKPAKLHTSGHASVDTLKKVVKKIKPKRLIPIHTTSPERYKDIFPNVVELKDGVSMEI